jgi:hypothetical protein
MASRTWHHWHDAAVQSESCYSESAVGDTDPWVRHLPLAWRATADPKGRHPAPARPYRRDGDMDSFRDCIAWWAPLLHLIAFGCGWPRPEIGIRRWLEAGQPAVDPRLAVVKRWWGPATAELAAWACRKGSHFRAFTDVTSLETATDIDQSPSPDYWKAVRSETNWVNTWGGGTDAMHLVDHALSAVNGNELTAGRLVIGELPTTSRPGTAVLLLDGYAGWYGALHRHGEALKCAPGERSWRIDVVCRPVGWLGTYRRSRTSGRWFAGQHQWHELGIL